MNVNVDALIMAQAVSAWFMTGLIWFVQVAHYPLMARVGERGWIEYERAHTRRTTLVVAPVMLVELVAAILLMIAIVGGSVSLPGERPVGLLWVATALLAVVGLSTFLVQVRLHGRLTREFDRGAHKRLVMSNWVRTLAWSARAALLTALLA